MNLDSLQGPRGVAHPPARSFSDGATKTPFTPAFQENVATLRALPEEYGSIRKISRGLPSFSGRPCPIVIHIHDVHMNGEAQDNIGRTVRTLMDRRQGFKLGLVALEGAFGPLDFSRYRNFPDRAVMDKVADYLLREGKISGSVHAALSYPGSLPPFLGVDDEARHDANVRGYKDSARKQADYRSRVARWEQQLREEKSRVYNPDLRAFDDRAGAYRDGFLPLGGYVKELATGAPLDGDHRPQLRLFLKVYALEKSLDLQAVQRERRDLLDHLVRALPREQADALLTQGAAFGAGQVRQAEFYGQLENLCRKNGTSLRTYPAMGGYLRYVALSDALDAGSLFRELSDREEELYALLARTPEEKRLVAEDRRCRLTAQLVEFALTPEEWREYRRGGRPNRFFSSLDLRSFEAFYEEAQARDGAMAENLLKALKDLKGGDVAVLVTGGFHAAGMEKILTKGGVTVVSFVPKLTKAPTDGGSAYLSVFAREKTPLDRLFAGEKLSTAPKIDFAFAAPAAALLAAGGGDRAAADAYNRLDRDPEWQKVDVTRVTPLNPEIEINTAGGTVVAAGVMSPRGNMISMTSRAKRRRSFPLPQGGLLYFLNGREKPETAWVRENLWLLALTGISGMAWALLHGSGAVQPPVNVRLLSDLAWGAFLVAHIVDQCLNAGRPPSRRAPIANLAWAAIIAVPNALLGHLPFAPLNLVPLQVAVAFFSHYKITDLALFIDSFSDFRVTRLDPYDELDLSMQDDPEMEEGFRLFSLINHRADLFKGLPGTQFRIRKGGLWGNQSKETGLILQASEEGIYYTPLRENGRASPVDATVRLLDPEIWPWVEILEPGSKKRERKGVGWVEVFKSILLRRAPIWPAPPAVMDYTGEKVQLKRGNVSTTGSVVGEISPTSPSRRRLRIFTYKKDRQIYAASGARYSGAFIDAPADEVQVLPYGASWDDIFLLEELNGEIERLRRSMDPLKTLKLERYFLRRALVGMRVRVREESSDEPAPDRGQNGLIVSFDQDGFFYIPLPSGAGEHPTNLPVHHLPASSWARASIISPLRSGSIGMKAFLRSSRGPLPCTVVGRTGGDYMVYSYGHRYTTNDRQYKGRPGAVRAFHLQKISANNHGDNRSLRRLLEVDRLIRESEPGSGPDDPSGLPPGGSDGPPGSFPSETLGLVEGGLDDLSGPAAQEERRRVRESILETLPPIPIRLRPSDKAVRVLASST